MKKHLLPPVEKYFKACLHTHSSVSDGKLTPEEVRDAYKAKGYSILALTDHSVIVPHPELNREDLLMITGVEIDIDGPDYAATGAREKVRHMCLLAKDPTNRWLPFRDPEPFPSSVPFAEHCTYGDLPRDYSPEGFNKLIDACNDHGYLVSYNHPAWSLEYYPDYIDMKGLWSIEYQNSACIASGYDENNGHVYRDLLNRGNRLVPIFADDMHRPEKHGLQTLGYGWVMVGAEKLEYGSVMEALERGDLYASGGPVIHSLTWEDGILKIECSRCDRIQVVTQTRSAQLATDIESGPLTHAAFDMHYWLKRSQGMDVAYFRLILTQADGRYAVTRAYHLDEL